jgi:hypothetical protein
MPRRRMTLPRAICVVAALCLGTLAPGEASAAEPAETLDAPNWVFNVTLVGIGVMRYWDGDYSQGKYDAVLPPAEFSDLHFEWNETRGVYFGPGYRGEIENVGTQAVTTYACSTTGRQIHLREGNNYVVKNVFRC